jgi:putative tryptophan/tyrosine transport system substrate-binding protein
MITYHSYRTFTLLALAAIAGLIYQQLPVEPSNAKRIAIFIPAVHPAMDDIEQGFKTTVQQGTGNYAFTTYNANGNKTLLRAQAEEIAQQQYDLIFTIGTTCTHTMHTVTTKKGITTPIVFTAIDDPVTLGIVKSLQGSHNHLTGCTVQDDFENQCKALLEVKPSTKHVLFVYDPGDGAHRDELVQTLTNTLRALGVTMTPVQVFSAHEIQHKVMPYIENCDVVMIYTDHTTVSGIDSLITLCNRFGKTLFASDLSSGAKGAALAYGVQERDHGTCAGQKARMILDDGVAPAQIPVTPITTQQLRVNTKTMHLQGLERGAA